MSTRSKVKICSSCGYLGQTKQITKGSIAAEILLWIIVFPVGIIYSIWRLASRYQGCPMCQSQAMIPADSPMGKKLLADIEAEQNRPMVDRAPQRPCQEKEDGVNVYNLD